METIMNHKKDFPKVVINVGGVKHEVFVINLQVLRNYANTKHKKHKITTCIIIGNVGCSREETSHPTWNAR